MSVMIRSARESDIIAIARTHVACWEETYRGIMPDATLDSRTVDVRVQQWGEEVRDPAQAVFVAHVDGDIVGFSSASANTEEDIPCDAFLHTLYVRAHAHRRGVARALLAAVASAMIDRGHRSMALLTLRDRNPACAFYERLGALLVRELPTPEALGSDLMDRMYAFSDLRVLCDS